MTKARVDFTARFDSIDQVQVLRRQAALHVGMARILNAAADEIEQLITSDPPDAGDTR